MKALSEIIVKSENEMKNIGRLISRLLKANDLITFEGDLGVGKTFLCKSIINSITNIKEVPSPTFNLVQTYPLNKVIEIWHCDFYRINNFEEMRRRLHGRLVAAPRALRGQPAAGAGVRARDVCARDVCARSARACVCELCFVQHAGL